MVTVRVKDAIYTLETVEEALVFCLRILYLGGEFDVIEAPGGILATGHQDGKPNEWGVPATFEETVFILWNLRSGVGVPFSFAGVRGAVSRVSIRIDEERYPLFT